MSELIEEKLRYFVLLDEGDHVLVLMPFLYRKIVYKTEKYYDVISPYGYSGPLFDCNLPRGYLLLFWQFVDEWYRNHNVVSEFIRFSLNNNCQFYSGTLTPTLTNVKGFITTQENQWKNFKQKVRNNYRRSISYNLKIEIVSPEIDDLKIELFHCIYTKTMTRINAEKQYFHSLEYFKSIINLSQGKALIAFVYFQGIAISAELILISGTSLFSYLGGTLSDYFKYRPNDFLKIEVINWARKNNLCHYVLGGGRTDSDSLYQYKKSFFPNDSDVIYYTGRKIINEEVYNMLNSNLNTEIIAKKNCSSFFPSYRKI
ncbi:MULTISPECIES: GNAT family N-acetyltransferase [Mangrovimonas]|uniref:GNAT family N-acetyltransferase n=1 Tax=Mangrovimonas TaxID=1211036 RepID=UPI001438BA5D|nr:MULTISPECIES: GNAT family N-acetyltransferase [Mangrovimonas]